MADDDRIFLGHKTAHLTGTLTRPANGDAYSAGQVIGDAVSGSVITIEGAARSNGGAGMIVGADIVDAANQETKPDLELWLFSVAPASQDDQEAFAPTAAELAYLVGIIAFSSSKVGKPDEGADGNCVLQAGQVAQSFKCAASSDDLYGVLVVRNDYEPVEGEVFTLIASALQDF